MKDRTLDLEDSASLVGWLDSSNPSTAPPLADVAPLQESGVVGLALVESGLAACFGADLERRWRTVQWRWRDGGGGGGRWWRRRLRRMSATMESSAMANLTQSQSHIW